jgi:transcriptional regulator with XRE-family HTH domain
MADQSAQQRKELGMFLTSRRARVKPEDVGMAHNPQRRRTPGLRREEVALLAGVSVSWYTWLEQGRDIRASADTLTRLAEVLRLDGAETILLFALASHLAPPRSDGQEVTEKLTLLVDAMHPIPAYIRNSRLDIISWNTAVAELFVDYGKLQPHERNTLRLMFLYPPYRELIVNWAHIARASLEQFRIARATAVEKAPFNELVEELRAGDSDFERWWSDPQAQLFTEGVKVLQHPQRGVLTLSYNALVPQGRPELSLVTYLPTL